MQCPKPRVHDNITLMMYHALLPKYKRSEIKTVCPNTKAMDGWVGGLKRACMHGWVGGCMDGWMDGWMDGLMDGWMDGWMDGRTDGWMDGWMDRWVDGWVGD